MILLLLVRVIFICSFLGYSEECDEREGMIFCELNFLVLMVVILLEVIFDFY